MILTAFIVVSIFFIISLLYSYVFKNLLMVLLVVELLGLFVLFTFMYFNNDLMTSPAMLFAFFSLFVVEGVLGLIGLVSMVLLSGTDNISLSFLVF